MATYGKINTGVKSGRCPHLKMEPFVKANASEARPAQGTWRGSAAAAVLAIVQRRVVPKAVDSGLLLVKYTLQRRLA